MATEIAQLFARIGADVTGLTNGLASAKSGLKQLGGDMTSMGASMTAALTLPLVGVGVAAAKAATDLNTQMRNIQSISKQTDASLGDLTNKFRTMSVDLTQTTDSATNLAKGFYQIQSSGIYGADAMTVLSAATKAATAGLTTTETATKAIVSVLNAYSLKASDASRVSDTLFRAVDIGIFSFEQLSGAIGDTLGSAQAAGVPFEEVAAALAAISKAGINVNEAATSVNQVLLSMIKPGDKAKEAAAALGIQWDLAALKSKGLSGVMSELANHTELYSIVATGADDKLKAQLSTVEGSISSLNKWKLSIQAAGKMTKDQIKEYDKQSAALKLQKANIQDAMDSNIDYVTVMNQMAKATGVTVDQLAELFPNVRALRGALALMRNGGKDFEGDLKAIANSAGATGVAFDIQTRAWSAQFENMKNRITNVLIALGDQIMPVFVKVGNAILPFLEKILDVSPEMLSMGLAIAVVVAALPPLITILGTAVTVISALATPMGLVTVALGLFGTAWVTNFGNVQGTSSEAINNLKTAFSNLKTAIDLSIPAIQSAGSELATLGGKLVATTSPAIINNIATNLEVLAKFWKDHGTQVVAVVSTMFALLATTITGALVLLSGIITFYVQLLSGDWKGAFTTMGSTIINFFATALSLTGVSLATFIQTWIVNITLLAIILQTFFLGLITQWIVNWTLLSQIIVGFFNKWVADWTNNLATILIFVILGMMKIYNAIKMKIEEIVLSFTTFKNDVIAIFDGLASTLTTMGQMVMKGFTDGLLNGFAEAKTRLVQGMADMVRTAKDALGIASPSKVFEFMGNMSGAGYQKGFDSSMSRAQSSMAERMSMTNNNSPVTNNWNFSASYAKEQREGSLRDDIALVRAMAGA